MALLSLMLLVAAAQALADAKTDAASLYQPKGDYEAAGAPLSRMVLQMALAKANTDAIAVIKGGEG